MSEMIWFTRERFVVDYLHKLIEAGVDASDAYDVATEAGEALEGCPLVLTGVEYPK
jgi:hypothetical protein